MGTVGWLCSIHDCLNPPGKNVQAQGLRTAYSQALVPELMSDGIRGPKLDSKIVGSPI